MSHDIERLLLYKVIERSRILLSKAFGIQNTGSLYFLKNRRRESCRFSVNGMKRKRKYAGDGRKSGSTLVNAQRSLASRRWYSGEYDLLESTLFFSFFLFADLYPLHLSFCYCAIRERPGAARPFNPRQGRHAPAPVFAALLSNYCISRSGIAFSPPLIFFTFPHCLISLFMVYFL